MSNDARFLTLRAGPLTLEYDSVAGDLRYIRWGEREIVRRVYAAVRNENWFTVPATLTEAERTVEADSFRVVYHARHAHEAVDFRWRGTITGEVDGTVTFAFDGHAHADFRRNRIGICVLHPADVAGQTCRVTHTTGTDETGAFPALISPHQPFFDIAAISQNVAPGVTATIRFEGGIFEMEDQRNWLDASFKTYSTPLALPMPVSVAKGDRVQQSVTLSVSGALAKTPPVPASDAVTVRVGGIADVRLPLLGLLLPREDTKTKPDSSNGDTALFLSSLPIDHFQADLDAASPDFTNALMRTIAIAKSAGKRLIVSLRHAEALPESFSQEAEWEVERVYLWLIVPPTEEARKRAWEILPKQALYIGGASGVNFTELNRERPDPSPGTWNYDYVGFAGNPQVHAFDDVSILETPPTIATALRTARTFTDATLCVGPLTFYGSYQRDDPRQKTVLAALWYFAVLTYAIYGDVSHVTLCETIGPRGVVDADGETYPLYHLLNGFVEAAQGAVCEIAVSDTVSVAAVAFDTLTGGQRVLVANLTSGTIPVTIAGMKRTDIAGLRVLSEQSEGLFGETETVAQDPDGTFVLALPGRSVGWLHLETPK